MRVNSAVAVLTLVVLVVVVVVTAKAPKSPYRARLHKNRRIGHGLGREFGTYGGRAAAVGAGAAAAGAAIGSQVADEDEFEVDEVDPDEEGTYDDEDEEGGEYVDDDEYVQSDEEAAREAEVTTVKVKPSEATTATSDTEIINSLLNKGYDWRVRPPGTNLSLPGSHGPVVVNVNMLIRSISKIDDVNMEYSVQMTFRESWIDGRLAYGLPRDKKPDFLILTAGQQIWMPDSFFQNEKHAQKHMIDKPNVLIRVHKDGKILYSVRISLVLSCPMHLHRYPHDIQTCFIDLASYAYTMDDIEYLWKEDDPVQLKGGLESSLPSFELNNVSTTYCTSKTNTGVYSCLRTVLRLQRQFSYYLLQLYIPSSMLVIVSWVSFWLDRNAVPARVTLGVTTLLTITTQASGINAKLPPVSYVKAVDLWIGACMTFIFSALLEFATVTYISSRKFYKTTQKPSLASSMLLTTTTARQATLVTTPLLKAKQQQPALDHQSHIHAGPPGLLPSTALTAPNAGSESPEVWVKQNPHAGESGGACCASDTMALNGGGHHEIEYRDGRSGIGTRQRKPQTSIAASIVRVLRQLPITRYIISHFEAADSAKKIDYVSRILFPCCFITFNICYWTFYSTGEEP